MSPDELKATASGVYGPRWQSALARALDVNVRTVQRWAVEGIDRATTATAVSTHLARARRLILQAPSDTPGIDRDDDAYDEVRPHVETLISMGEAAGWHPAEIATALLATTADWISHRTSPAATIETLEQIIAGLSERVDNNGG